MRSDCTFRRLGLSDYESTVARMSRFTDERVADTPDEVWLLEHPPVFTLGTSSQLSPRINPDAVPLVKTTRGGQITYHGPGQLVAYLLLDIRRLGLGPRRLVQMVEQALIRLLASYGLDAERRSGAPGVYLDDAKVAALGLRIRNGCCFHGLSLNVDMDTKPFQWIDPCGYPGLAVTTLAEQGISLDMGVVTDALESSLRAEFNW